MGLSDFKNNDLLRKSKRLVLAYSGGLDSSVLLHLLSLNYPAKKLLIWHINHQLQDAALEMEQFCEQQAKHYQLPFQCTRLNLSHLKSNIEAQAREARYDAFSKQLNQTDSILLTAHHADDQVETLMLNLFRGTGVLGLRGIAASFEIKGMHCMRPLLDCSRAELESYAYQYKIKWINDPSNLEQNFDRNYIRHELLPRFKQRWPAFTQSFKQVASHQIEAAECLSDLADNDLTQIEADNGFSKHSTLVLQNLKKLSLARQKNVLKHWLLNAKQMISKHQLNRLIDTVTHYNDGVKKIELNGAFLGLFKGWLYLVKDGEILMPSKIEKWLKQHNGYYVCRLNAQTKNISSHFLKRQFQEKCIPPWLRAQVIFEMEKKGSKRVRKTYVL